MRATNLLKTIKRWELLLQPIINTLSGDKNEDLAGMENKRIL